MKNYALTLALALMAASPAFAADPLAASPQRIAASPSSQPLTRITGRVAVMDGRTLWYPQQAQKIRLADIDACELPQWALDPDWRNRDKVKAPTPVACGPLAKAWLKRTIGNSPVACQVVAIGADGTPEAICSTGRGDLALEMLRVGWARISAPMPRNARYLDYQTSAMAARYGMWATYVLDMIEWRRRAVDQTPERQPIADLNLLATRQSEISPPFADARAKPRRTDR